MSAVRESPAGRGGVAGAPRRCPHCRGVLEPQETACRWCGAPVPPEPPDYRPGDVLRVRNPFKGGHEEEVTVERVDRGGYGLEVRDGRGQLWGYLQPKDVVAVVRRARRPGA